jgi:hypothetical protein
MTWRHLMTVEFVDPRGLAAAIRHSYRLRLTPDTPARLCLVPTQFPGAGAFLGLVGAAVTKSVTSLSADILGREEQVSGRQELDAEDARNVASHFDGAILGYGHCGSCTPNTVQDALALADAGLPVAVLVTTPFLAVADFKMRASGWEGVPMVELPYPVAGTPLDYQKRLASDVAPTVIRCLTSPMGGR